MFSGYEGASFALNKTDIDFECVGVSEIDPYAIQCIKTNFPNYKNYGSCINIDPNKLPDFDLLTAGFPCQDVSIAGKRDLSKGRTKLFNEIIRIAAVKKPRYMLLENVKGLLSMKGFWQHVKSELNRIGYTIRYKVLNSKDYGIPQTRERIWILCNRDGFEPFKEIFPHKEKLNITVKDILEDEVDDKYYLSEKQIKRLKSKHFNPEIAHSLTGGGNSGGNHSDMDGFSVGDFRNDDGLRIRKGGISPCLHTTMRCTQGKTLSNQILVHNLQPRSGDPKKGGTGHLSKSDGTTYPLGTGNTQAIELIGSLQDNAAHTKNISPSLTSAMGKGGGQTPIIKNSWRRLTPRECFRLMGFLNDEINLDGLSDTQRYKLAGNGWEIQTVSKIFRKWLL